MLNPLSCQPLLGWSALDNLIGRTPLLRLDLTCEGRDIRVYAKLEMNNFSGSIKDRMALMILQKASEVGALEPGQRIAEATSGNAGIAFAAIGRALGHRVTIFMPDWMSKERRDLLRSYGADLVLVSKEEGGFLGSIAMAEEMGEKEGAFLPRQFANVDNCLAHYLGTGPELIRQLADDGAALGAFVAGVGTGGTVMGVGRALKEHDEAIAVHPIEPAQSPTLSTGHKVGSHRIQGVSDEFIPDICKLDRLDPIVAVDDGEAIAMARQLSCELGLGVGISSGANLIGAVQTALARGDGKAIATVFADGSVRYLSTDLCREDAAGAGALSRAVEIVNAEVLPL